jgi:hypothetical protein
VVKNYVIFLEFLHRLWLRTTDPTRTILTREQLAELSLDLLAAFWGTADQSGYWSSQEEDARLELGILLLECRGDIATVAACARFLDWTGEERRRVPFIVAGVAQAAGELGLLTPVAAQAALSYMDRREADPTAVLDAILRTRNYFAWDYYLPKLAQRYGLLRVRREPAGFASGEALIIDADRPIVAYAQPLAVFADWITVELRQNPQRKIFQLLWGAADDSNEKRARLVYEWKDGYLSYRPAGTGSPKSQTIASGTAPELFSTWKGLEEPAQPEDARTA